ncbi:MAG TPA: type II CAAX endopeptidase family protein [Acidimicrobiales bacterium]|nr:type II CAAX endopeptidase family protein [Acidimicrobiales bacterium]
MLRTGPALGLALAGFFVGIVLAGILGLVAIAASGDDDGPGLLIGSFVGLWIPLVGAALLASFAFGTRSPRRDLGLRLERADLGLGVLVGVAGLLAATAVQLLLSPFPELTGTNTNFVEEQADSVIGTIVVAISTMVGAPIVEELFFRGLVQRALDRLRWLAVVAQAFVFGLIHVTPEEGLGNVGIVLGVGAFGFVLGVAVKRWGRLGPAIIGHALFNAAAVVPLLFL